MSDPSQQSAFLGGSPSYGVGSRIVAPLDGDTKNVILELLLDVAAFFGVYSSVEHIYTDEPLLYKLTPEGRKALSDVIKEGRVSRLRIIGRPDSPPLNATINISNDARETGTLLLEFGILLSTREEYSAASFHAVTLMKSWFPRLRGATAGTNADELNSPENQRGDQRRLLPPHWLNVTRFVQDIFWSNCFGPDLCMRLGGQDKILRDAPVAIAEALGEGVWLQLTEMPPPDRAARDRFAAYIAPLLDWTDQEVIHQLPTRENAQPARSVPEARRSSAVNVAPIPALRWTDEIGDREAAINIHTSTQMTKEQQEQIIGVLEAWADGSLNENNIPWIGMSTLSSNVLVIRGELEFGSYDTDRIDQALEDLRVRLAALPGTRVREIVLGLETIG